MHEICSKNTTRCWKLCLTSFCVKNYLLPNFKDVLLKNAFCIKSAQRIQLSCWKLCFTSVSVKMVVFSKLEGYLAKKFVLHQMCSKNTTRCWKLCLTSFCVKNYLLQNFKDVLLRNKFCMKSAQTIQLAVKNCVGLQFVLKTTFCPIISMSCYKIRFIWNLLKEYNSLLKTVFYFSLN